MRLALSDHYNQEARRPHEDAPILAAPLPRESLHREPSPQQREGCGEQRIPLFISLENETPFAKCLELDTLGTSPTTPDDGRSSDSSDGQLDVVMLISSPEELVNVAEDEKDLCFSGEKSIARVTGGVHRVRSLLTIPDDLQEALCLESLSAPDPIMNSVDSGSD